MIDQIDIFFFKKPKICNNPKHKILFEDDDDIYNPFSSKNIVLSFNVKAEDVEELYNCFYQIAVHLDLSKSSYEKFFIADNLLKTRLHKLLYKVVKDNSKDLLSVKVPYWGACIKVSTRLHYGQTLCIIMHASMNKCRKLLLLDRLYMIDVFMQQVQ